MDKQTDSSGRDTYSELRIVLVGYNESGKSSTGNTMLGSDEFDLKKHGKCVKKEGVVAGRQISVIDTPGRHRHYTTKITPKFYQEEVVRSVTLCPPGPHALLLNVNVNTDFVELYKEAVMQHLNLFGKTVWKHIIVLFTHGDQLEDKDIQQYIKDEGEPLQWLLDKCEKRFHVFNNEAKGDSTQVAELLKKIDEMVAGNHGSHFVLDREMHCLVAQKQRQFEELKEQQCSKDTRRMGNKHMLKKQRIVLLGQESAGKTSTADTILNSQESDLKPTLLSTRREAEKWQVTVVDTPGWLTNDPQRQMPKRLRLEIVRSVGLCPPGPHAFLLVIPAKKTFTEANEAAINNYLELLGKNVWNHTIVLFTHADWLGVSPIELFIDSEGEPLNRILEKCGNRYHTISNIKVDQGQVEALLEKIEVMVAKNDDRFYEMDSQKDMADEGCGDENEVDTDWTFQLPSDLQEVLGQRERKPKSISTITPTSEYETTTLSECDSAQGNRPKL